MSKKEFLVGTSGWSYQHWGDCFYPDDIPKNKWFDYYLKIFSTVEINATFYHFFADKVYRKWYQQTSENFKYVLKVPRIITHRKRLINVKSEIQRFCRSASILENKCELLLLQLPPNIRYDVARLKQALLCFDDPQKVAVEFRDPKWFTDEVRELLFELKVTFCSADSPDTELLDWVTSDIAYIRLHGHKKWYEYNYSLAELKNIAKLARKMKKQGAKKVYIFFNNDYACYAPKNAIRLMEILC
ncbi:MAG: DUF72 domain-containing protein [Gammaproteobacteria bacterium]|jgi:uncharacterized protein YecE (DUF72 family)